ncbi:MAG TPA: murein L,D-transpeptidase catalytic domain family protein [Flavobacteriaceae bacterium]|nr:murein L,D-transpeptidase catalytic domain family protein [Flavobacteriaceae bacterium]
MRKKILLPFFSVLVSFAFTSADVSSEFSSEIVSNSTVISSKTAIPEIGLEERIENLYNDFTLTNTNMPSLIAFQNAMIGYYKLSESQKIENNILTIVDFSLPSSQKRMWILDMEKNIVLFHTLVAHGRNTGLNEARNFSNVNGSHKSSLGFYLTAETYFGKHGLSLRLDGMEKGINDQARSRAIVVHGADYATPAFVNRVGRLGRSYGCPAVPTKLSKEIIQTIKNKSCFFIYFPSEKYVKNSQLI